MTVKLIRWFAADRLHVKQIKWGIQPYGKDCLKETPSKQLCGFHPLLNIGNWGRLQQTEIRTKNAKANYTPHSYTPLPTCTPTVHDSKQQHACAVIRQPLHAHFWSIKIRLDSPAMIFSTAVIILHCVKQWVDSCATLLCNHHRFRNAQATSTKIIKPELKFTVHIHVHANVNETRCKN